MSAAADSATSSALARTTNSGKLEPVHQGRGFGKGSVEDLVMRAGGQQVEQECHLVLPVELLDVAQGCALPDLDHGEQHALRIGASPVAAQHHGALRPALARRIACRRVMKRL